MEAGWVAPEGEGMVVVVTLVLGVGSVIVGGVGVAADTGQYYATT